MKFVPISLPGAFVVELEPCFDSRGYFVRTWCQREFERHGLNSHWVQGSASFNARKGTWRGLHFQAPPHEECKLIRCISGAICDVIVDLRSNSPTLGQHTKVELSAQNRRALYVPEGFAHGFLALVDDTEVLYQMSQFHCPESTGGFRWNDPSFGIQLPLPVAVISEQDQSYPDYRAPM